MSSTRDVRRLVAARFVSRTGSEAAFFVGMWGKAAYELDATASQLAGLMAVLTVAVILGSAVGGVLTDRYGPRRTLAVSELFFVPAALAMTLAPNITVLAGLAAVWGFVGAPVVTAGASFAPFLVTDKRELERTNAWIEGAGSAAFVAGPAAGALLAGFADVDWVFVLDAVTSLVAAVLVLSIPLAAKRTGPAARSGLGEFREGLRVVYSSRSLRYYVLAGTLLWLSFGAFGALEPLFFRDVVRTGVESIGWVNTLFGLAMLAGAAALPRLPGRFVSARGLAITIALSGLGTVLYVGSGDLRLVALGAMAWGPVIGLLEPLLRTLMHRDAPEAVVGRVIGTAEVHRRLGELLPLAVAPALAAAFGVQLTLVAGGLFASLVALSSLGHAASIDRAAAERGLAPARIERLRPEDEPVSPNP